MTRHLALLSSLALLSVLAAVPSWAVEPAQRLVPGGGAVKSDAIRTGIGESRSQMLSVGALSLGTLTDSAPAASATALPFLGGRGPLAVGGYVTYGLNETRLSASARRSDQRVTADLSAAYAGPLLGFDSVAAVRLGAGWATSTGFSPNPNQRSASLAEPYRGDDVTLSLSLMHEVTPSLSFSGLAEAVRPTGGEAGAGPGFMVGAGMGYRF